MGETLRSSGRLSAFVLASRVLGVVRESIFAALFGASQLADAFWVAYRIPNLLRDLFAEGALSSAFVPTFTAAFMDEGKERAFALGNLVLGVVLVATGLVTTLGMVFTEEIVVAISAGFDGNAAKVAQSAELARIMMPLLALVSLSAVWMGMLNAQKRFGPPAVAPAVFNVVSISVGAVLFALGGDPADLIVGWAVGTLTAGVAQALIQLPALWRSGYRPWVRVRGALQDPDVRRVLRLMGPAVLGLAAVQVNVFVNTRFASALGDGPVSQLGYAFRLFYLPVGMFGVALATVTTTRVSEDAARGDKAGLAERAHEGLSAAWMLTTASGVGLFLLAEPVVALIFERGKFGPDATAATAMVLRAYLVGLVPYSLVKILAPSFYSVDRPRIPLVGSMVAVATNITFNALTFRTLGAPGIALGTSLGALANLLILRSAFRMRIGPMPAAQRMRRFAGLIVANGIMGLVVWGGWLAVGRLGDALSPVVAPRLLEGVSLFGIIAVGFLAYVGILRAFRYPGADLLWSFPAKIGRRITGRRG